MFIKIIFSLFLPFTLLALELKDSYEVESRVINSSIFGLEKEFFITNIDEGRVLTRLSAKEIKDIFKNHGYSDIKPSSPYITFSLKSELDTTPIKDELKNYFLQKYKHIVIKDIKITPRGYMKNLPDEYTFGTDKNTYLLKNSTVHIVTPQSKKYFFDYEIEALLDVYVSNSNIKKGTSISSTTFSKKTIVLDRLRDMPIFNIDIEPLETNKPFKKGEILTIRDATRAKLIKKGSIINVSYKSDDMSITFNAKALQDGRVNDTIRVQNQNKKTISVVVIGENLAVIK